MRFAKQIGVLLAVILSGACSKNYLNLNPISAYSAGSFYKTQSDFELANAGIYNKLQGLYNYVIPFMLESRSDNTASLVSNLATYDWGNYASFTDNPLTGTTQTVWQGYYTVINAANEVLDQIGQGSFTDTARQRYLTGEARFLRGFAYFQLGWMYGGVPIIDHEMTTAQILVTGRASQDATLDSATTDLQAGVSMLPQAWPLATDLGRATSYAAEGILARLYLFQKNFPAALPLLKDIISSGRYSMAASYPNCFLNTYNNSPEQVFQIQFLSGNVGQGTALPTWSVPLNIKSPMFPQGGNSIFLTLTHDLYLSYEPGDGRRDFTIQHGYTNTANQVDTTTCFYIKFAHGTVPTSYTDWGVNLPILRYTDVELMYAEVLNEAGYTPGGEAFNILNTVRARAELPTLTAATVPNQAAFRNTLFHERRMEFAGEYLRWFDLVRSGTALQVINTLLATPAEGGGAYTMKATNILFPIPGIELTINTNPTYMYQNPGY
jgi:hypothetical protein